jgi:hypothetical protein
MPIILGPLVPVGDTEIVLDPSEVAQDRVELAINTGPIRVAAEGIDWGDAQIEAYLAEGALGQVPVDFRVPNRTITIPLILGANGSSGFAVARAQLNRKVARFQQEGGWLRRGTGRYADLVNATLRLPDRYGHLGVEWDVVLTLEALPDFYGDEIELDDITGTGEIVQVLQQDGADAVIDGDYPGRVRIVVDEDDGQTQLGVLWAFRSRRLSSAATAQDAYEAEDLTPLDAAAIATVSGASGGGADNVVRHSSLSASAWTPVLSTEIAGVGHMTHVGTYRIWARVYSTGAPQIRLTWDAGDLTLPEENPPKTLPGTSLAYLVDLGEVRLDRPPYGTHQWQAQIQAKGANANISIDRLWIQPIDDGGARITIPLAAESVFTSYVARDEFDQAAGALDGKTAAAGGTWDGAGDTDDFAVSGDGHVTRSATSDAAGLANGRLATCGTSVHSQVQVQARCTVGGSDATEEYLGVLARYVDASNWLIGALVSSDDGLDAVIVMCVAGTPTVLATSASISGSVASLTAGDGAQVRLQADESGRVRLWVWSSTTAPALPLLDVVEEELAAGGALEEGLVGIYAHNGSASSKTPTWDDFLAFVPVTNAVIYPNQSLEIRTDGIYREGPAGGVVGPLTPVGGHPRIPPSGIEGRPVELFVKISRGDLDTAPDAGIDDVSARVYYRPSWLFPLE